MSLPVMTKPKGAYETKEIKLHNGETRLVYLTDQETPFPEGGLITSRTDVSGIITHANEAFVGMSGWERKDLMGVTHAILRHPDMPHATFRDLWETIQAGKKWHGYVKNLRRDGGFYWVYATVIPNIRNGKIQGFTSVRRKASPNKIAECEALYRDMRKAEA